MGSPIASDHRQRSLISNAFWNIGPIIVAGLVAFVTVPVIVRHVGADDYGLYVLILTIGGFITLADMGLTEATVKYVAEYYSQGDTEGVNRVYGTTLLLYIIVGLIGGVALVLLAPFIVGWFKIAPQKYDLSVHLMRYGGAAFFLMIWVSVFEAVPQALQRYDVLSRIQMGASVLLSGGSVIVVVLGWGISGLVIWFMVMTLLRAIAGFVVAQALVPQVRLKPAFSRLGMKEVFSYGIFSSANALIARLSESMDRLILGIFFGSAEVAYLAVPKNLLTQGASIYNAAGHTLFPRFSSMTEGPEMRDLFFRSIWALLCLSLFLFVPTIVVLPDFLRVWVGADFAERGGMMAQYIAGSYALQGAFVPYFALLKGTGRVKWLTALFVATTGINILVTIVLVRSFGLMGAAYRTWVFVWVGFVVIYVVARNVFKHDRTISYMTKLLVGPIVVVSGIIFAADRLLLWFRPLQWPGIICMWGATAFVTAACLAILGSVIQKGGGAGQAFDLPYVATLKRIFLRGGARKGKDKGSVATV